MKRHSFMFEIFLVSLAAILLEISFTRVFSFKLFYYFTYLTIGIALLGIGSGGVIVSVWGRLRQAAPERVIAACCAAGSVAIPIGYVLISIIQLNALDIADSAVEAGKLVVICSLLYTPFLLVGVVVSTIFAHRPRDINRLYFSDLVGAGIGCAICMSLFNTLTPPGAIILSGMLFGAAGLRLALLHAKPAAVVVALALVGALPVLVVPTTLPDPVPDRAKTMSPQRRAEDTGWGRAILFSRWSSVFRVDVAAGPNPETQHLINHDGNLGSTILRFDGDMSKLERFDIDGRSTPFAVLKPAPKVLIIGAAGGHEILVSLYFGASSVTAVELNPVTVSLLTDHFADYSGHLGERDRVTLVNGEGRSFLKRDDATYDLIWFVAPDSYAAMNAASSGGFVLSESYLFTEEAIIDSLRHLEPGGVVCLQTGDIDFARKPNRAVRYLSTARSAFARIGIEDFPSHVLVSSTPELFTVVTILLSRDGITEKQVASFYENADVVQPRGEPTTVWHPVPPDSDRRRQPVNQVVTLDDAALERWRESYPYQVSPVTDNSPFFWHFAGFVASLTGRSDAGDVLLDPEDAKGERVLVALLVFAVAFSAILLLAPFWLVREEWRRIPFKGRSAVYFAALGLGFMFFEITLIQKLTLFLGYPTYSLTVTLFTLLIFSGIGSLVSVRYLGRRNLAFATLVSALVVLAAFYQVGIPWVVSACIGMALPVRAAIAGLLLAPLGVCLGAFMPIGLRTVASITEQADEYVAWSWAVNGFFSVISSVLATILSMTFGFNAVLWMAVAIYAVGVAAFQRLSAARS